MPRKRLKPSREFNQLGLRLFQDVHLVGDTPEKVASWMVKPFLPEERRVLGAYLDEIVSPRYTGEELKALWAETPTDFYVRDGEELRSFLKLVRDKLRS